MNIKEYRMSKGLTQTQVGDKLGISRTTVAMWEAGLSMPRTDKLQELSNLYECTVDDLLVALNEENNQA